MSILRVMRIIARMNVGGPALQVSALMRGLDPARFEQRLYVGLPEPGEGDYRALRAAEVPVHLVPEMGRAVRPGDDVRALAALVAAMREYRPHLVHTHTAKAGTLGRVAAAVCRVPARVHTFHGHLLYGYFPPARTKLLVRAERALARRTDALVTVAGQVRDDLLAAGVGAPDRYTVIPPGVSLPQPPAAAEARRRLGLPAHAPVVAVVGRLTAIKRPDRMLAVARLVRDAVPGTVFVVCGAGDRLAASAAEAAAQQLDIRFLGWRPDVETVYAAADLTLLTSDNEGLPVCLVEAGLAGRAAVATDVGGVAEVVLHERTGLLARPDAGELSAHVVRLLRDPELRGRMGRAAQEFTGRHYGSARLVADTAALYERLGAR